MTRRRGDSDKNSEIEFKEFIAALATFHAGSKEDKLKCKRAASAAASSATSGGVTLTFLSASEHEKWKVGMAAAG